ncbi:MAG: YHS domain-containing (seleno)protein [Rhodospirillales bacterium]
MRIMVRHLTRAIGGAMVLAALLAGAPAFAKSEVNSSLVGGVAIEGTDAVAYFTEGRPVKGTSEFAHRWKGAEWRFKTAANRDAFAAAPEKYAPRFGGYCAWAVSQGYTAGIDPEAWTIHAGGLYLNYSKDVRAKWRQDIPGNIAKGEKNWPKVLEK